MASLLLIFVVCLACISFSSEQFSSQVIHGTGHTVGYGEGGREEWRGEVIHLAWKPRLFLLKRFLSDEECDHLIDLARPTMTNSTVVDSSTGRIMTSDVRTSTGTFLAKNQDEVVGRIERRIARVTMIPTENQESMQILHYAADQYYMPHFDYFLDKHNSDVSLGGQRVVTVLMYLSTVEEGGETIFPDSDKTVTGQGWSPFASRKGFAVKAVKGDAVMFYALRPDGKPDPASLHGGSPVLKGNKWSATKWIHVLPIEPVVKPKPSPGGCYDDHEMCPEWKYFDECQLNPKFMDKHCRKSCNVCK